MKIQFVYQAYQSNRHRFLLVLLILNTLALFLNLYPAPPKYYQEISYLQNANLGFSDIEAFFKSTAQKKGADYAFDLLRVAPLPKNTDVHLLAHGIGNVLYRQKGLDGITSCTNDFRNACSHSIVVGLFTEKGVDAINDIAEACRSAPGGPGAYGMCFHGLGHGVLAFTGYEFMDALGLCRQVGTVNHGYIESAECVGGMVMELVAGVHDPMAWEIAKTVYFKTDNPLYPCDQGFIPSNARHLCFLYLTPHLWEAVGADPTTMTDDQLKRSFAFCSRLSGNQSQLKESCYGGFGKEFVTMVQSVDIRKVAMATKEQRRKVYELCLLAVDPVGIGACVREALNSFYWGGENDPKTAILFCVDIDNLDFQSACFNHLIGAFGFYNRQDQKALGDLCDQLPPIYQERCHAQSL